MAEYSAQGSITVKRLRNGDSLFITLELNGKPLYQGIDPDSGTVRPDWEQSANQPVITPRVTSTRGNTVTLSCHGWRYNGNALVFNGAMSGEWQADSTGMFLISTTGALKIVKNLASTVNIANDSLTYTCTATVAGVEYNITKSIDVIIQNIGASSYYGTILSSTEQLDEDHPAATVQTKLYLNAEEVTEYHVKWFKDDTAWTEKAGQKEITVSGADVDGAQLFIARFYKSSEETEPVASAGLIILDTKDEYVIVCSTGSNKEVDTGKPVTVTAKVVRMRDSTVFTPGTTAVWRMDVMDRKNWTVLKTASSDNITVTTEETDRDGEENDVEVVAEVTWS